MPSCLELDRFWLLNATWIGNEGEKLNHVNDDQCCVHNEDD